MARFTEVSALRLATPDFHLVHMSDNHIDDNDLDKTWYRAAMYLAGQVFGVDAVMETGDLSDDGLASDYDAASLYDSLAIPVYHVKGNHDIWDAPTTWEDTLGVNVAGWDESLSDYALLLWLDSSGCGDSPAYTNLEDESPVSWLLLNSILTGAATDTSKWLVIGMHHPLVGAHAVGDAAAIIALLQAHASKWRGILFLHGHNHVWYSPAAAVDDTYAADHIWLINSAAAKNSGSFAHLCFYEDADGVNVETMYQRARRFVDTDGDTGDTFGWGVGAAGAPPVSKSWDNLDDALTRMPAYCDLYIANGTYALGATFTPTVAHTTVLASAEAIAAVQIQCGTDYQLKPDGSAAYTELRDLLVYSKNVGADLGAIQFENADHCIGRRCFVLAQDATPPALGFRVRNSDDCLLFHCQALETKGWCLFIDGASLRTVVRGGKYGCPTDDWKPSVFLGDNCDGTQLIDGLEVDSSGNSKSTGIYADRIDDLLIENVRVYGGYNGLDLRGCAGASKARVLHCDIIAKAGNVVYCADGAGAVHNDIVLRDCILDRETDWVVDILLADANQTVLDTYNLLMTHSGYAGKIAAVTYSSLANWQAVGHGANSFEEHPIGFLDATKRGLALTSKGIGSASDGGDIGAIGRHVALRPSTRVVLRG